MEEARYLWRVLLLDIKDGPVEGAQRHLHLGRLARRRGRRYAHGCRFARAVLRLVRLDLDVHDGVLGRDADALRLLMDAQVGDGGRLDEEVGLVAFVDGHVHNGVAGRQVEQAVADEGAVVHLVGEQDVAARPAAVDHQVAGLPRAVGALVGDELQIVEAVEPPVEVAPADPDQSVALDRLAPFVRRSELYLQLVASLVPEPQGQDAALVGGGGPALQLRLFDVGVVRAAEDDARDAYDAFGLHGAVVRRDAPDRDLHLLTRAVVAPVAVNQRVECLARDLDVALACDDAAAGVADLGLDDVTVVPVGMVAEGGCRVDLDLDGAVLADGRFALLDQLARAARGTVSPPPRRRRPAAPCAPPGKPFMAVPGVAVARAVEPVPIAPRVAGVRVLLPQNAVADGRVRDGRSEVVIGLDDGRQLLAEPGVGRTGLDRDFELGLPILLDAEGPPARVPLAANLDPVDPERRLGGKRELAVQPAEIVRARGALVDLVAARVVYRDFKLRVGHVPHDARLHLPGPHLELHRLLRTVDGPVGDDVGDQALLLRRWPVGPVVHSAPGDAAVCGGHEQVHVAVAVRLRSEHGHALLVGLERHLAAFVSTLAHLGVVRVP